MDSWDPQFTWLDRGLRQVWVGAWNPPNQEQGSRGIGIQPDPLLPCSLSKNLGIPAVFSLKVSYGSLGDDLELCKSRLIFCETIFGLFCVDFLALGVNFWPLDVKFLASKFEVQTSEIRLWPLGVSFRHLIFYFFRQIESQSWTHRSHFLANGSGFWASRSRFCALGIDVVIMSVNWELF